MAERLTSGSVVRIRHDSILDGLGAVVIDDDGSDSDTAVYLCTNGPVSHWYPLRHTLPRSACESVLEGVGPRAAR